MPGTNNFPKLHNAMWPGLVGKGPDSEPPIDLDTMIRLTAAADVDGVKFDGIDIFHAAPHTNIDFSEDEVKALADKAARHNLAIGSIVGGQLGAYVGRRLSPLALRIAVISVGLTVAVKLLLG